MAFATPISGHCLVRYKAKRTGLGITLYPASAFDNHPNDDRRLLSPLAGATADQYLHQARRLQYAVLQCVLRRA